MNKPTKATLIALSIIFSQTATAEEYYAGINLGAAKQSDNCPSTWNCDDTAGALRAHIGRQINTNLAVEIGVTQTGDFEHEVGGTDVDASYFGADISALGIYPINDTISVHGRGGVAYWELEGSNGGITVTGDGTDPLIGLGAAMRLSDPRLPKELDLTADWARLISEDSDIDFLFAGIRVRF